MATTTVQPTVFHDQYALVKKYIADKEAVTGNAPSASIESAVFFLVAITNAENIFRDCVPQDQQVQWKAKKIEQFNRMIACLQKADYCRLNLVTEIRQSIDSGTKHGWFPKVYGISPQHVFQVAPTTLFTFKVYGKFKYADTADYGNKYAPTLKLVDRIFEPIEASFDCLTFKPNFEEGTSPFMEKSCTLFYAKLFVPYKSGYVSGSSIFEFDLPIRALPTCAGTIEITSRRVNDQLMSEKHTMIWQETRPVELNPKRFAVLTFTGFDGKKQEFSGADLTEAAKKIFPNPLITEKSYLKITQVDTAGEDQYKWNVETVPPIGL